MDTNMKVKAFTARPDEMDLFAYYGEKFGFSMEYCPEDLTMDNMESARGFTGLSCVGTCDLSRPALERLAGMGVRYLSLRTIGYDNVDVDAARELGLRVSHASYSPYSVANYTVMLMLMCMRKALYIMMRSHTADYSLRAAQGREMQNMTVGIIGTGKIGRAVIQNLSGFGCKILAYDPYPPKGGLPGVEFVPLDKLYARADIIALHTLLNDETYHMISDEAIAKMKPGVILSNTARGPLVDTKALIAGIESGKIASAGIDCFEDEDGVIRTDHNYTDLIQNHDLIILKSFQNTIVTPHVAFYTDQAVQDMVFSSLESLHQFAAGQDAPLAVV